MTAYGSLLRVRLLRFSTWPLAVVTVALVSGGVAAQPAPAPVPAPPAAARSAKPSLLPTSPTAPGAPGGFAASPPPPPGGRTLGLQEVIRRAQTGHPSLQVSRESRVAAYERTRQALGGYLPNITYNFTYTRRTANCVQQPGFFNCTDVNARNAQIARMEGRDPPGLLFSDNFWSTGITLNQTLFDFFRTRDNVRASEAGHEMTKQQLETMRLQVVQDAKVAYYGVLAQQALVQVAEQTVAQRRKHLFEAKGFYQVGARTKIDVVQAEADLANADVALVRQQGMLAVSKVNLLATMGESSAAAINFTVASERHPEIPEVEAGLAPMGAAPVSEAEPVPGAPGTAGAGYSGGTPEGLLTTAYRRPDVKALQLQAVQQSELVKVQRDSFLPTLTLQAGPQWAGTDIGSLTTNLFVTINFTTPLGSFFNPYVVYHQVAEARANERATRAAVIRLKNDVSVEVESARLTLLSARRAIDGAERALVAARERVRLAEGRYHAGTGNIIELSDAQAAFTQAQANRVQADYDVDTARARLARALGRE